MEEENIELVKETQNQTNDSVEQQSLKRKRKRTSRVWDFFDILPQKEGDKERAKCRNCDVVLICNSKTHGTKNLLSHIDNCPKRKQNDVSQMLISRTEGSIVTRSVKFDPIKFRQLLSIAIIRHDLPFSFVEYEGIRDVFTYLCEESKCISQNTARVDVMNMFNKEKKALKVLLEDIDGKICFTSDLWTSINTDGFITLTAHYVDKNWVLNKKILSFCFLPTPHTGLAIYEKIYSLLCEWKLESKILSFTLDNASSNDVFIKALKNHLSLNNKLFKGGKYLHIRCCAHVLNLIVKNGLQCIDASVEKIRESIKYIKGSQVRKQKFLECVKEASIQSKKGLRQDVPTRWNSTYLMLESALIYQRAFSHMDLIDSNYKNCPTEEDWNTIERILTLLVPFYDATVLFSGTQYVTSNLYAPQIFMIQHVLETTASGDDIILSNMAKSMLNKFKKYWSSSNIILTIAVILDPRYKFQFVDYMYNILYGSQASREITDVRSELFALFDLYTSNSASTSTDFTSFCSQSDVVEEDTSILNKYRVDFLKGFDSQNVSCSVKKSQLQLYLDDDLIPRTMKLDVLSFWKGSEARYPQLARMARDILSIPLSTVASESAFSISGRILDQYRSSLLADVVEALVCTRDWLFGLTFEPEIEDVTEDVLADLRRAQESHSSTNM